MTDDDIKVHFAELEAAGLIVRMGEFRPNAIGQLEPVFVVARHLGMSEKEHARRMRLLNK